MNTPHFELEPWAQDYLESLALTHRPNSVIGCKSKLRQFQSYRTNHSVELARIQRLELERWMRSLYKRGLSPSTRSLHLFWIKHALRWLKDHGQLKRNPEDLIRLSDFPKIPEKLPRPLEPDLDREIQRRLECSTNSHDLGLLIMRKTGMRVGELAHLSFHCLHQDSRGRTFLKVPLGKLYNERFIPVDAQTVALVEKLQVLTQARRPQTAPPHLLSSRRRERVSECMLRFRFQEVTHDLSKPGDEHLHPHRFRHTYATELINAGMSLPGVMQLLGHRSVTMTLQYALVTQSTILEEYDAAQEKLRGRYQVLPKTKKPASSSAALSTDPIEALSQASRLLIRNQSTLSNSRETKKLNRFLERIRKLQIAIQDDR